MAGISLGICLNARILTAVGIGIPYAIYAIYLIFAKKRDYLPRFALMLAGFMLMVGVLAGFNYLTNGHPLLTGYEALWGKEHNPGFGHSGWGAPHTPKRGLIQNLNNLNALSKYLFEWCIPSAFFVMLFFTGGRRTRWDYILLGSAFSLSFVHFFYWYQGWCFGPRFMYEATYPLILLTARGIFHTPHIMRERFRASSSEDQIRYSLNLVVGFCVLVAIFVNVPVLVKLYSNDYWSVNADVQKAVKREKISNAVVFVGSYYGSVLPLNSPLRPNQCFLKDALTDEVLRTAWPPNQDAFMAKFWDVLDLIGREVYIMVVDNDDDTLKKGGFAWIGIDDLRQLDGPP